MAFGSCFPSARIAVILMVLTSICLEGVIASDLIPGIKNWDSIKVLAKLVAP
jgi:hypothetical protein